MTIQALPYKRLHLLHTSFINLRPTKSQSLPPRHHHPIQYAQMQMHMCFPMSLTKQLFSDFCACS